MRNHHGEDRKVWSAGVVAPIVLSEWNRTNNAPVKLSTRPMTLSTWSIIACNHST